MITAILIILLIIAIYKVFVYKMTAAVLLAYMEDQEVQPTDEELRKHPGRIIRERLRLSNKS